MVPLHNTPIVARKSFKIKYKIDSVHDDITRMAAFTKDSKKIIYGFRIDVMITSLVIITRDHPSVLCKSIMRMMRSSSWSTTEMIYQGLIYLNIFKCWCYLLWWRALSIFTNVHTRPGQARWEKNMIMIIVIVFEGASKMIGTDEREN